MQEKERYISPVLYGSVVNYHQEMKYIAHWLWWDGGKCYTLAIGKEQDSAGLEKSPPKTSRPGVLGKQGDR